jgi:hypothetical protein
VFLEQDMCLFCLGRYTFETPPSAITREAAPLVSINNEFSR